MFSKQAIGIFLLMLFQRIKDGRSNRTSVQAPSKAGRDRSSIGEGVGEYSFMEADSIAGSSLKTLSSIEFSITESAF